MHLKHLKPWSPVLVRLPKMHAASPEDAQADCRLWHAKVALAEQCEPQCGSVAEAFKQAYKEFVALE